MSTSYFWYFKYILIPILLYVVVHFEFRNISALQYRYFYLSKKWEYIFHHCLQLFFFFFSLSLSFIFYCISFYLSPSQERRNQSFRLLKSSLPGRREKRRWSLGWRGDLKPANQVTMSTMNRRMARSRGQRRTTDLGKMSLSLSLPHTNTISCIKVQTHALYAIHPRMQL